ncbi:hypothetical protein PG984_012916 [Apiospora sp. TS-2023a]
MPVIDRIKVEMGLGRLLKPEFATLMQKGHLIPKQQSVLHRARMGMAAKGRNDSVTMGLRSITEHFKDNWLFSLQNWSEGRYHAASSSVLCHDDLKHQAQRTVVVSYLLHLAFRCGLSPWAVVVLMVGFELACNAGIAAQTQFTLKTRYLPSYRKNQALESKSDNAIRVMGLSGSSGVMIGVATALAYLCPNVQMMGGIPLLVPLWPVIPLLLCTDLALVLRESQRCDVRRVLKNGGRTDRGPSRRRAHPSVYV